MYLNQLRINHFTLYAMQFKQARVRYSSLRGGKALDE